MTTAASLAATLNTSATTSTKATRALLACGVIAGPMFLAVGNIQGVLRPGYDFTRNALSQLSNGDLGWIQVTSFLLTGAMMIAGSIGIHRALAGGPGGTWTPRLIAVCGTAFIACGIFKADIGAGFPPGAPIEAPTTLSMHGTAHMLSAMVGFLALGTAFIVLGRHFNAQHQRRWAVASRIVPALILAGFVFSALTVIAFVAGAGLGLLWLAAVSRRLMPARTTT
jgi:hypothetical membrane protein